MKTVHLSLHVPPCVCVCVCVREREREIKQLATIALPLFSISSAMAKMDT